MTDKQVIKALQDKVKFLEGQVDSLVKSNKKVYEEYDRKSREDDDYSQKIIQEKLNQISKLEHENTKLSTRLDTTLYAMVVFKEVIAQQQRRLGGIEKQFKYDENSNSWTCINPQDNLKLAV